MHTVSYEFLMKPKESAGCHQTLSSRVGAGHETTGPWAELLTSLPKRGVGTILSVSHLVMKVCPCHVYSDSMPMKQIIGQIIIIKYSGATSSFEVES